ncbi:hypothetical protein MO973_38465 [Paenibacillus sp. TRM 82003]|uniref:hypothetical protein n=1 Tax=Kineococcus sp. TRM81007 TaxID=2925831 RepID=UPI001F567F41|nr:hypothetical protein [Kineococcus sp. TRM81007]MCI2239631.1 hypothetical protein [Kineococcus sp. TRM81007]MCI3926087.1 hypothetical protein [Paenibacillus sp. TRM 82003]
MLTSGAGAVGVTAVVAALLTACTPSASESAPAATAAGGLDLVVSPHPDDELEAWSLLAEEPGAYTVFVTLTLGEATVNCDPAEVERSTQTAWGELAPAPPPQGPGTDSCKQARTASWNAFLDAAAESDPHLPVLGDAPAPSVELAGHPARVRVADGGARVAVDGGDGELTADGVVEVVEAVLDLRGGRLPDLPLRRVVGASYANDAPDAGVNRAADGTCTSHPCEGDPRYAEYEHPDHWAVREALLDHDLGARDGTCVATWPSDPAATRTAEVPVATYEALTGLGERVDPADPQSLARQGAFQRAYGWLAFPETYWPQTELPVPDADGNPLIMARVQTFACR